MWLPLELSSASPSMTTWLGTQATPHAIRATCSTCVHTGHTDAAWRSRGQGPGSRSLVGGGPNSSPFDWDAGLYPTALEHRLRIPFLDLDTRCHSCGQVLDRFCDHAAVCRWAGDRNRRHDAEPAFSSKQLRKQVSVLKRRKQGSSSFAWTPTAFSNVPASTDPPTCGFPRKRHDPRCLGLRGHLLPPLCRPETRHADDYDTEPDRYGPPQADVSRHSQLVPSERHLLHRSFFF